MTSFVVPATASSVRQVASAKSLLDMLSLRIAINKQTQAAMQDANAKMMLGVTPGLSSLPSNAANVSDSFSRRDRVIAGLVKLTGSVPISSDVYQRLEAVGDLNKFVTFLPKFLDEEKALPSANPVTVMMKWDQFKAKNGVDAALVPPDVGPPPVPDYAYLAATDELPSTEYAAEGEEAKESDYAKSIREEIKSVKKLRKGAKGDDLAIINEQLKRLSKLDDQARKFAPDEREEAIARALAANRDEEKGVDDLEARAVLSVDPRFVSYQGQDLRPAYKRSPYILHRAADRRPSLVERMVQERLSEGTLDEETIAREEAYEAARATERARRAEREQEKKEQVQAGEEKRLARVQRRREIAERRLQEASLARQAAAMLGEEPQGIESKETEQPAASTIRLQSPAASRRGSFAEAAQRTPPASPASVPPVGLASVGSPTTAPAPSPAVSLGQFINPEIHDKVTLSDEGYDRLIATIMNPKTEVMTTFLADQIADALGETTKWVKAQWQGWQPELRNAKMAELVEHEKQRARRGRSLEAQVGTSPERASVSTTSSLAVLEHFYDTHANHDNNGAPITLSTGSKPMMDEYWKEFMTPDFLHSIVEEKTAQEVFNRFTNKYLPPESGLNKAYAAQILGQIVYILNQAVNGRVLNEQQIAKIYQTTPKQLGVEVIDPKKGTYVFMKR